jgi:hypothetical protein
LYLRFERGDLTMLDLLMWSGRRADASSFRIDCSEFYVLANEIDGGGPTFPSDRPLAERVAELFAPLAESAQRAWTTLNDETSELSDWGITSVR